MKNAFFTRGRLLPLVGGGLLVVIGFFAGPAAYSAGPVVSQTVSPFGQVNPQVQQQQQAEVARLVAKLSSIQVVSLLTPAQKAELVTLLGGLSNAERVTLLTKFHPAFPKLPQTLQDSILAQLAVVVPLPPPVFAHVLTFDEFLFGTVLTTQYQALGVTASGTNIVNAIFGSFPAKSVPNVAYAPFGQMVFNFDAAITGTIHTVAVYVSFQTNVVMRGYDAYGALLAQSSLQAAPLGTTNALLSVTSSGAPIARVELEGPSSSFQIDNLSF